MAGVTLHELGTRVNSVPISSWNDIVEQNFFVRLYHMVFYGQVFKIEEQIRRSAVYLRALEHNQDTLRAERARILDYIEEREAWIKAVQLRIERMVEELVYSDVAPAPERVSEVRRLYALEMENVAVFRKEVVMSRNDLRGKETVIADYESSIDEVRLLIIDMCTVISTLELNSIEKPYTTVEINDILVNSERALNEKVGHRLESSYIKDRMDEMKRVAAAVVPNVVAESTASDFDLLMKTIMERKRTEPVSRDAPVATQTSPASEVPRVRESHPARTRLEAKRTPLAELMGL